MADFNQFGTPDEENGEIKKLNQDVVWQYRPSPCHVRADMSLVEHGLTLHIGSGHRQF